MLKAIMENQPIGIIRLSELLNFPQHKVRYSLRILEQEGLIKPSPEGAVTTDKLEEFLDYLKGVLDSMSGTVQELRKTLGRSGSNGASSGKEPENPTQDRKNGRGAADS